MTGTEIVKSLPIVRVFGEGQDQIFAVLRPNDADDGLTLSVYWASRNVPTLRQICSVIERKDERMHELVDLFTGFTDERILNYALSIESSLNKQIPPEEPVN